MNIYNSWGYKIKTTPRPTSAFERLPMHDDEFSDAWIDVATGKIWWTSKGAPIDK